MRALRVALLFAAVAAAMGAPIAPSTSPPGGLSPSQTPQFILFTHDDGINRARHDLMASVTDGRTLNGCPLTATMFVKTDGTDCAMMMDLYRKGYELADHSVTHPEFGPLSQEAILAEIEGARAAMVACGVPEEDIVGFRSTYYHSKPEVRAALVQAGGFEYDSSLIENSNGQSWTKSAAGRVWPWDLRFGMPPDCVKRAGKMDCLAGESYPGIMEVPAWELEALGPPPYHDNPGADGVHAPLDVLKANFDAAYAGNRAPLPIFIHNSWLAEHKDAMTQFIDYVAPKQDVWFVTMRQLVAWMKNPVPADQLTPEMLGCGFEGGRPGTLATAAAGDAAAAPEEAVAAAEAPSAPELVGEAEAAGAPAPAPAEAETAAEAPSPAPM